MFRTIITIGAILFAIDTAPAETSPEAGDVYANPDAWLCRPGREDACTVDLDATIIAADGTLTREPFHADPAAPIDCFYVYPTVSTEPGGNADRVIEPEERRVAEQQFARFGAKCRLFAPMYRQFTMTALRAMLARRPIPVDRELGYDDVVAAWNDYLARDNHGRGVVLIGHSQGSGVLTQLIKNEIDGKPVQARLVSAILMGTNLPVPEGRDVGGAFQHIPVCRSNSQTGCVIAFADFRADAPPPVDSLFGMAPDGMQAVCANPAALGGGPGAMDAYLSARTTGTAGNSPEQLFPWTMPPQPIETPFVKLPGLLTGQCVADERGSYLAVTLHPISGGARTNEIPGDVIVAGKRQDNWGLHRIDANLNIGNLVVIVGEESKAYLAKAAN
jgi:hypothetical protein